MKEVQELTFETQSAYFTVQVSAKDDHTGFVGEYSGATPKYAQAMQPGQPTPVMKDIPGGKIEGSTADEIVEQCRAAI